MKNYITLLASITMLFTTGSLSAQNQVKKDTVYYLVDTAKIPLKDRMFLVGQEGNFYGYRLTCQCDPHKQDPYFVRDASAKGQLVTSKQVANIRLISIRQLIHLVINTRDMEKTVFRFIEVQGKELNMYHVRYVPGTPPSDMIEK